MESRKIALCVKEKGIRIYSFEVRLCCHDFISARYRYNSDEAGVVILNSLTKMIE